MQTAPIPPLDIAIRLGQSDRKGRVQLTQRRSALGSFAIL